MASENLPPQIISRVMAEIRDLVKRPVEGIEYYDPSENDDDDDDSSLLQPTTAGGDDTSCVSSSSSSTSTTGPSAVRAAVVYRSSISEIYAKISGPEQTPFEGGKFLMKLVLSEDYPNTPPRGYFLTKIYHPNVATNGDICVNTLKKDWAPDTTLKHVLQVIRCLLIVPFPESSLNDEAGKLFMESYDEFARRARIMTEVHAECNESASSKLAIVNASADGTTTGTVFSAGVTSNRTDKSSATDGAPGTAAVAAMKKKAKDAKTKSLKRL